MAEQELKAVWRLLLYLQLAKTLLLPSLPCLACDAAGFCCYSFLNHALLTCTYFIYVDTLLFFYPTFCGSLLGGLIKDNWFFSGHQCVAIKTPACINWIAALQ